MGITINPFTGQLDLSGSSGGGSVIVGSTPVTGAADNEILYNDGGVVGAAGPLNNGQVLIGTTGSDPTAGNITGSSSITVTNGAGTIAVTVPANGITNTELASAINATKIADGSVTNAEFQFINSLTSNAQTQIDSKINLTEKGANNGVATLDAGGKVPVAQLPSTVMEYQGAWNPSTNTPTLADGTGDNGDVYRANANGTADLGSGPQSYVIGDFVIYNGTIWQKSPGSDAVLSVNGQQGVVLLDTDDIPEGASLYFTNLRAQNAITGAASTVVTADLTPNRATISNVSGKLAASVTTDVELSYVSGVTSSIQDQIDNLPVNQAQRDEFTLSGTDITNQYVDLSHVMISDTERFTFLGVVQRFNTDYTVSLTGGAGGNTRVFFTPGGTLATGSLLALVAGDIITIQYFYTMGLGGGGGGGVTYPLLAPGGTVNAPSYAFSETGNDTGMWSQSNGDISFSNNAALGMNLDASHNLTVVGNIAAANYPPTGNTNTFAGFDGSGNLESIPGLNIDTTTGGMNENITYQPNNVGGGHTLNSFNLNFDPLQNSPNDSWNLNNLYANFDVNSSGFTQGSSGDALILHNATIQHHGTGDIGSVSMIKNYFDLGNGTDPISVKGMSYAIGFANVNAGVTMTGAVQGYGFQPDINVAANLDPASDFRAFYDFANIHGEASGGYSSVILNPIIGSIPNSKNFTGITLNPTITTLNGNANFSGLNISSNIGTIGTPGGGNWQGINVNPTIANNVNYAAGINVNMNSVTNAAGSPSTLLVQDITYTFFANGDNNNIQIQYTNTVLAGSEVASLAGNIATVQIQSGVSTATQVRAAWLANLTLSGAVNAVITGTAGNAQTAFSPVNLAGGVNPGRKLAIDAIGDVDINGALSFTGALSVGQINAFASQDLTTLNPGVNSIDSLITSPSLAANGTVSGSDLLGINTAMLLTLGDNATITSNIFGYSALGLPAVVSMGTGSSIDKVAGAVFALSLDTGATGGTIDEVNLCRSLAIPNGTTTITRLMGYEFDLPFGDPGTTTWGFYSAPVAHNYMGGDLLVGGTAVSDDVVTNNSVGIELKSTVKAFLPSRMTTTQRDALTAVNGMVLYNSTTDKLQVYAAGAWVDLH